MRWLLATLIAAGVAFDALFLIIRREQISPAVGAALVSATAGAISAVASAVSAFTSREAARRSADVAERLEAAHERATEALSRSTLPPAIGLGVTLHAATPENPPHVDVKIDAGQALVMSVYRLDRNGFEHRAVSCGDGHFEFSALPDPLSFAAIADWVRDFVAELEDPQHLARWRVSLGAGLLGYTSATSDGAPVEGNPLDGGVAQTSSNELSTMLEFVRVR